MNHLFEAIFDIGYKNFIVITVLDKRNDLFSKMNVYMYSITYVHAGKILQDSVILRVLIKQRNMNLL